MQKPTLIFKIELRNEVLPPIFRATLTGGTFNLLHLLFRLHTRPPLSFSRRYIPHRRNNPSFRYDPETPRDTLQRTLPSILSLTPAPTASSIRPNSQLPIISNPKIKPDPTEDASRGKPVALNGPDGCYVLAAFAVRTTISGRRGGGDVGLAV